MSQLAFLFCFIAAISVTYAQETVEAIDDTALHVTITDPEEGNTVTSRYRVRGTVSDVDAEVWLVVLAEETGEYWPQPRATVKDDGAWSILAYLGEANTPKGTSFTLRAFANPETTLRPGEPLEYWPDADAASEPVTVQR